MHIAFGDETASFLFFFLLVLFSFFFLLFLFSTIFTESSTYFLFTYLGVSQLLLLGLVDFY